MGKLVPFSKIKQNKITFQCPHGPESSAYSLSRGARGKHVASILPVTHLPAIKWMMLVLGLGIIHWKMLEAAQAIARCSLALLFIRN